MTVAGLVRLGRSLGRDPLDPESTDEILTIAPDPCRRIIGIACLQAIIVPRRLIAEIRS
jgi:hypothetical protein